MKIEYTPERGRGFVRPGETEKQQNWGFSGIKKAAPKWSRLSEQITRCAVCVCDPKHKHGDDSRYQAGGQCNQSGSVRCHTCNERFSLYSLRNCSRAKAHGANLSDSCSIFLRRLFRAGDNVLVNSLSVIVLSCIAMRRNTSHHGADSFYPLGSIPRRFSSVRPNSLSQLARLMPSLCASLSNCSFSSGEIRILNCGDCPSPLGLLSRLIVDKWSPIELAFLLLGGHLNTRALKKAKPRKCHYHSQGF
ncbi:hypothetical protein ACNCRD_004178 [Escherichia coli]|uniref:Prophage protein n=6 Tax=Enterobacteriaceae TaxID=543 RepID=A0AAN1AKX7_ECO57|nr:hypothetical protein [Escherichia coli]NP_309603.1 hypothetical protein ECs_1576 [Escherichia coli O157:H7 str. Sakai]EET3529323.1 hypothetical protein [Escherichia coli O157:NM]EFW7513016.1 hypothetical protein [Shigella sonnei]EHU63482.1 hypothetical protein ECDEC3B_1556 [Escherichia coli DEC3B]EHU73911.1 hypothetical protein ECDEC3C_2005 [Escherichia coli DEC3C]EHU79074.1 hypothetical protein ECDEC3D_1614 [Escherichia coli DEC3D]EHV26435.1 hypothetical protein ECDEC4F_1532 [Escherichia